MEEKRLRNKMAWFSFAGSLLVVWIHAYNLELFLGEAPSGRAVSAAERFLGENIGQIAVPGFFMLSGCRFFRGLTREQIPGKLERRIYSVLIPYILWNFLYYAGYVIGSRIPGLTDIMNRGVIPVSLSELTEAVVRYKYNPVFWFLFQLLLLAAAAPVLFPVLKNRVLRPCFFLALCAVLALDLRLPLVNADALLYYTAAGAAALTHPEFFLETGEEKERRRRSAAGLGVLLAAVLLDVLGRRLAFPAALALGRLCAVTGLWLLIPAAGLKRAGRITEQTFFLYATHFAAVRLINKTAARLLPFPAAPAVPLALYLLMPAAALGVSTVLYRCLKRLAPGLCRILNGNRGS